MSGIAVALAWARATALDPGAAWLSDAERAVLAGLHLPKRAADWRLGRWVAKEAVVRALGAEELSWRDIEVLAGPGGEPRARILAPGVWPATTLSLSHSGGVGFAAAGVGAFRLGCDVEEIAPRSDAFVADYLTAEEAAWVEAGGAERHERANLLWSAKESALKALGEGLRLDTRSVGVVVGEASADWAGLDATASGGAVFRGVWRQSGGFVWTVVAERPFTLASDPFPGL